MRKACADRLFAMPASLMLADKVQLGSHGRVGDGESHSCTDAARRPFSLGDRPADKSNYLRMNLRAKLRTRSLLALRLIGPT